MNKFRLLTATLASLFLSTFSDASAVNAVAMSVQPNANEIPSEFRQQQDEYDYTRREVMIPMRDGVKLHTVVLVPRNAHHRPILLTRTPYGADRFTNVHNSPLLESALGGYLGDTIAQGGYIRVVQDVRGKYGSEGDYVMTRPLRGPLNPTTTDHATDGYDTIDWLVKNIPESNGRVGMLGLSYDGFTTLMALTDPHPALKVAVPMNPMVDGWMGDDWFHKGAARIMYDVSYIYAQESSRTSSNRIPLGDNDVFDAFLKAGSAVNFGKHYHADQLGAWAKLISHPNYDAYWQQQALDKILALHPFTVPTLLVHSLWDEEDIYGAPAVYKALSGANNSRSNTYLVLGPWRHGQELSDASSLGPLKFDQDTGKQFRDKILAPFLAHYLQDGAPPLAIAKVSAFETGSNSWRALDNWPEPSVAKRLYLHANSRATFDRPSPFEDPMDDYVSDPAKPVPYRDGVIKDDTSRDSTWERWLVDDQRFAARRPDVIVYQSEPLQEPVRISGQPIANIVSSTTGTDTDIVVKLIDVYPNENPKDRELGGYQLPVSMDIMRGRFRESFETPKAITPNSPLLYRFTLPTSSHVFLPGHRIMVQIQSSWFPLYDRNPQSYIPNIFFAQDKDYHRATIAVYHTPENSSFIELPIAK